MCHPGKNSKGDIGHWRNPCGKEHFNTQLSSTTASRRVSLFVGQSVSKFKMFLFLACCVAAVHNACVSGPAVADEESNELQPTTSNISMYEDCSSGIRLLDFEVR